MQPNDVPHHSGRDTYMVIVILIIVGLPLFVFFNILTMGLFLYLALGGLALAGLGAVNYFLWGRSFMRKTAWEREEAKFLNQDQTDPV
jgi:hypothetical protein